MLDIYTQSIYVYIYIYIQEISNTQLESVTMLCAFATSPTSKRKVGPLNPWRFVVKARMIEVQHELKP